MLYIEQIIQEVTMYISDVNDEDPQFEQNRYEHDIPEVRLNRLFWVELIQNRINVKNIVITLLC